MDPDVHLEIQTRIRVPGSPVLMWSGGIRQDHRRSTETQKTCRMTGHNSEEGIVRMWTFRGAEKESDSEGERREPSASWDVPPAT